MQIPLILLATILAVPAYAGTKEIECTRAGVKRRIEIKQEVHKAPYGCAVFYNKRDEGAWRKKKLWSASYEQDYCNEKANKLVTRLESWGWLCKDIF